MSSIEALPALSGQLSCEGGLTGTLSTEGGLVGKLSIGVIDHDPYTGDYEVIPRAFDAQILPTANKLLKEDMVVLKIPYYETSNAQMGKTVYIADEVNKHGN